MDSVNGNNGKTTRDARHSHRYRIDNNWNGRTTFIGGHDHQIIAGEVIQHCNAAGYCHNHGLTGRPHESTMSGCGDY